jgi:hypothetical protein
VKVIVGVTTTKARLDLFFYSFQSLRRQSLSSFRIVVSLSREPYLFDEGIDAVPDWMAGENVQVDFVQNSGPYRKLLPQIARMDDDDMLVTADDDIIYSEHWLKRLVSSAQENPDCIVCCRARNVMKNLLGRYQNYSHWDVCLTPQRGPNLLPTCGAGAVFRKRLLDLRFLSDEAYLKIAPTADDIWYRIASLRTRTDVFVDPDIDKENGYIRHFVGLERVNLYQLTQGLASRRRLLLRLTNRFRNYFGISSSGNDRAWKRSLEYSRALGSDVSRDKQVL